MNISIDSMIKLIKGIKKQFKKNEYNYQNTQIMEKVEEKVKQYQWKKGENFGKVVEVESTDSKFTIFTDGSQIFNSVLPEFLDEVIDGKLPFPGSDQINALSLGESPIKNKPVLNTPKETINIVEPNQPSPLEELVGKLSKKNIEPLHAVINLNIPNKDIFNMLIDNADEDKEDLMLAIARVAISQIEINKLQEYLTEEVTNFINNYYNG